MDKCDLQALEQISIKVVEVSPDAKLVIDEEGAIVIFNAMAELMFGYAREEVLGQKVEVLLSQELRTAHVEHRTGYFEEPRVREMGHGLILSGLHRRGHTFPIQVKLAPIATKDGIFALAVVRRVPRGPKNEDSLIADVVCDERGVIVDWDSTATLFFGWTQSQVLGKPITMLMSDDSVHGHMAAFAKVVNSEHGRPRHGVVYGIARNRVGQQFRVAIVLSGWDTPAGERRFGATLRKVGENLDRGEISKMPTRDPFPGPPGAVPAHSSHGEGPVPGESHGGPVSEALSGDGPSGAVEGS